MTSLTALQRQRLSLHVSPQEYLNGTLVVHNKRKYSLSAKAYSVVSEISDLQTLLFQMPE